MRDTAENKPRVDFNERPFIAIWEATQACDLACVHCRASAQPLRSPYELSTAEAHGLIDQIAALRVPVFVITGGDPPKRPDIFDLVEHASKGGLRTSLTPSATPLLTCEAMAELQRRGLARLAGSLDGSSAEIHDAFRRVPGSYERTLRAVRGARELGLPVQINTTITRRNMQDFEGMVRLLETLDIAMWSVFFLGAMTQLPLRLRFPPPRLRSYSARQDMFGRPSANAVQFTPTLHHLFIVQAF